MKYFFLYKTINAKTSQYYIGKHGTDNPNDGYQGGGIWVQESKKKDIHLITGIVQFSKSEEDVLLLEEKTVTKELLQDPLCMNRQTGGSGCVTVSKETRKRMSKAKSKQNNPNWGRNPSEETRKKLSLAKTGQKHPFYGKTHSDKTRQILSEKGKGKKNSQYGKPRSKSTIDKIKLAWERKEKINCPHCGYQGIHPGNMERFHFDNCKNT